MTKTRIDGYLSRIAQTINPTALVMVNLDQGEEWILRRDKQDDLGLGDNYHLAEQGIRSMIRAERAKGKI